jgi:hypothetical protein
MGGGDALYVEKAVSDQDTNFCKISGKLIYSRAKIRRGYFQRKFNYGIATFISNSCTRVV